GGNPPTKLWSRQLTPDGLAWAPGSTMRELTRTTQAWEGPMIENPAMVRYADRYFLLYSANNWWTDRYAIGYAECAGPLGPCSKPQGHPLLGNHGDKLGPGGPSLFFDTAGRLKMAYHHWTAPYVGYPTDPNCDGGGKCTSQGQRRMSITDLRLGGSGLEVGPARPSPTVLPTDRSCPADRVPEDGFTDVPAGSTHEAAVDCITWWGVTLRSSDRYMPGAGVTRGQMASFLSRAVLNSGGSLPPATNPFFDDDASVHQEAIGRLAAAGLVQGTGAGRFAPDAPVSREQMATFLVRVLRYRTGTDAPAGLDWFSDDTGSVHEANINSAATAGLAGGSGYGTYVPRATVRRDQMATFLSRLLQAFVVDGAPLPGADGKR
ncbi:MAG TPA: S-layer homology domain-containing protein, partial [Cryptosporangiaceae bacterium]|nr:S-layer homology domain-containing protein [Cryptosporangiaceae bacterium]